MPERQCSPGYCAHQPACPEGTCWRTEHGNAAPDLVARGAANPQTIREHLSGHSIVSRVLSGQRPYDGNSHPGSYRIECACGWSRDGLTEYGSASAFTEHLTKVIAEKMHERHEDLMAADYAEGHEFAAFGQHEEMWLARAKPYAMAATDALLAKGEIREKGIYASWKRSLVIPIPSEAS